MAQLNPVSSAPVLSAEDRAEQRRRAARRSLAALPTYLMLSLFLLIAVVPFIIIFFTAFKTSADPSGSVFAPPVVWRIENLRDAWITGRFNQYFRSSVIVVIPVILVSTLLSILSGYAFGRRRFPLKNLIFGLFLVGIMVPQEAFIIPLYYDLRGLHLTDTYLGLILPQIAQSVCFGTFWMRGFFAEVPTELEDAARVDGATRWQAMWRVMLPLVRPAILTMMVLFFIWTWNDFLLPLVLVSDENLRTLPLGLAFFSGRYTTNVPLLAAGATIVSLPTILFYLIFQRQFIRGMTSGSVTG